MNVRERMLSLRLKEKLEANAAYGEKLGVAIIVPPPQSTQTPPSP